MGLPDKCLLMSTNGYVHSTISYFGNVKLLLRNPKSSPAGPIIMVRLKLNLQTRISYSSWRWYYLPKTMTLSNSYSNLLSSWKIIKLFSPRDNVHIHIATKMSIWCKEWVVKAATLRAQLICSTSSMLSTVYIDISLIFVQLGLDNFARVWCG